MEDTLSFCLPLGIAPEHGSGAGQTYWFDLGRATGCDRVTGHRFVMAISWQFTSCNRYMHRWLPKRSCGNGSNIIIPISILDVARGPNWAPWGDFQHELQMILWTWGPQWLGEDSHFHLQVCLVLFGQFMVNTHFKTLSLPLHTYWLNLEGGFNHFLFSIIYAIILPID